MNKYALFYNLNIHTLYRKFYIISSFIYIILRYSILFFICLKDYIFTYFILILFLSSLYLLYYINISKIYYLIIFLIYYFLLKTYTNMCFLLTPFIIFIYYNYVNKVYIWNYLLFQYNNNIYCLFWTKKHKGMAFI